MGNKVFGFELLSVFICMYGLHAKGGGGGLHVCVRGEYENERIVKLLMSKWGDRRC